MGQLADAGAADLPLSPWTWAFADWWGCHEHEREHCLRSRWLLIRRAARRVLAAWPGTAGPRRSRRPRRTRSPAATRRAADRDEGRRAASRRRPTRRSTTSRSRQEADGGWQHQPGHQRPGHAGLHGPRPRPRPRVRRRIEDGWKPGRRGKKYMLAKANPPTGYISSSAMYEHGLATLAWPRCTAWTPTPTWKTSFARRWT